MEVVESWGEAQWKDRLIQGDNLEILTDLRDRFAEKIDLIYIDPPFATGEEFQMQGVRAYRDSWPSLQEYLQMMDPRLRLMHQLLSPRGSLYVHADWRVTHYLKVLLDEIFGRDQFRNMIIWHYGGRGAKATSRQYPRNYDMILLYSKSGEFTFNRPYQTRRIPVSEAKKRGYRQDDQGQWFKTAPRGDYTDESISRLESQGRVYRTRTGKARIKYFLPQDGGEIIEKIPLGDLWDDIPDMMHSSPKERTGYPTQKPQALIERIIQVSSHPGDLVADFFCGSGTLPVVAQRLGRRFLACDLNPMAIHLTRRRLVFGPMEISRSLVPISSAALVERYRSWAQVGEDTEVFVSEERDLGDLRELWEEGSRVDLLVRHWDPYWLEFTRAQARHRAVDLRVFTIHTGDEGISFSLMRWFEARFSDQILVLSGETGWIDAWGASEGRGVFQPQFIHWRGEDLVLTSPPVDAQEICLRVWDSLGCLSERYVVKEEKDGT